MLRRSATHHDEQLGELRHARGAWRGSIEVVPSTRVPLVIVGGRSGPSPEAVRAARDAAAQLGSARAVIGAALVEHAEPYDADGTAGYEAVHVRIEPDRTGTPVVEVGLRVPWDEEHVLGARLVDGRLVELNGSVAPL